MTHGLPGIGTVFEQRYLIRDVLGEGGFACVYRAHDERNARDVALKILAPESSSLLSSARFHREASVLATLQDPHSITLFDYGESASGLLWMAFEFVNGRDLSVVLSEHDTLEPVVVVHILTQCLLALAEAHARSVIHRDLKPANILVHEYEGDPWRIKLLDFGLAKPVKPGVTRLTAEGRTAGTPRYMSPEQVLALELGPPADLYSLGLVAHELLTGRPAIDGATMKDLLREQVKGPPTVLPPDAAPPQLRHIVEKMCVRNLHERYAAAPDVLRDLKPVARELRRAPDRAASSSPAPAPPAGSGADEPATDRQEPTSRWVVAIGLATVALVGLLVVAALLPVEETEPSPLQQAVAPPVKRPGLLRPSPDAGGDDASPPPDLAAHEQDASRPCRVETSGFSTVSTDGGPSTLIYVPTSYRPHEGAVIGMLRMGGDDTTREWVTSTGMQGIAKKHGAVLVAPPAKHPLLGFGPTWGHPHAIEAAWSTIVWLQEELCADPDKLFLMGQANGGRAADEMLCEHADAIAAVAVVGHRYEVHDRPCRPSTGRPYLTIEHSASPFLPIDGGRRCGEDLVLSLDEQLAPLVAANDCKTRERKRAEHRHGICSSYDCEHELRVCRVSGGYDHMYGERTRPADELRCTGEFVPFPYAGVIWSFFARQVRE